MDTGFVVLAVGFPALGASLAALRYHLRRHRCP